MNNVDNLFATVSEKVFEKPVLQLPNLTLSLSDLFLVGIIFLIAYCIFLIFKFLMSLQVKKNKMRKAQSKTLSQLASYIITFIAIMSSFSAVGYSFTYLLLGSTALLVGLGFGLQQLFMDLISGVILLIDKNINYGDIIRVDIPGVNEKMHGKLVQIGLRATQFETIDNEIIIVPNSKLLSSSIRSLMRSKGSSRFRVHIQVAYDTDMDIAKKLLIETILNNEKTDKTQDVTIIIKDFMENGVMLEVRFWMKELFNSEIILSEIRFDILRLFRENGVEIPYPKRVLVDSNYKN